MVLAMEAHRQILAWLGYAGTVRCWLTQAHPGARTRAIVLRAGYGLRAVTSQ
jgi:hypothetical protein